MAQRLRAAPLPFWLVVAAGGWGLAVLVAGFTLPVYAGDCDGDGCSQGSTTLVAVNGVWAAAVVAVPLGVSIVVGLLLRRAWLRPARWPLVAAWVVLVPLVALNIAAMLTIGLFIVPTSVLLVLAALTVRTARAAGERNAVAKGAPGAVG